jgi:hypothetical protein
LWRAEKKGRSFDADGKLKPNATWFFSGCEHCAACEPVSFGRLNA